MFFFLLKMEPRCFNITWPCFLRFSSCPSYPQINSSFGMKIMPKVAVSSLSIPPSERFSYQEAGAMTTLSMAMKTLDKCLGGRSSLTLHNHHSYRSRNSFRNCISRCSSCSETWGCSKVCSFRKDSEKYPLGRG